MIATNDLSIPSSLYEAGKYQEAIKWLNNFLSTKSDDAEAWSLLAQVYIFLNKDAEAEQALLLAIEINPNLPSVNLNQARLLLKKSQPEAALAKAQHGFDRSNKSPESWLVLAACLSANKRDSEALTLIEEALKAKTNYAEAFASRSIAKLRVNNIAGALEDLETAVTLKPHLTQAWGVLGSLRYQIKNLSGAIDAFKKAHELEPCNINYMTNLGELLRQENKIPDSIAFLEKVIRLEPKNTNAWINLGATLQQDNKIDRAKVAYKTALEINPKLPEIANNLGAISAAAEDWELALKYFQQALEVLPNRIDILANKNKALIALKRFELAKQTAEHALSLDKTHIASLLGLSSAYIGLCEYRKAKEILEQAHEYALQNSSNSYSALIQKGEILRQLASVLDELKFYDEAGVYLKIANEIKADDTDTIHALINHYSRQERWDDASYWIHKLLIIKPDLANTHKLLGDTMIKLGRFQEAEVSFNKAIALKPDYSEAHNNLGATLQELGRLQEAEISFNKAIAMRPEFIEAHINLGITLQKLGRLQEAFVVVIKSIDIKPTVQAKSMFIAMSKHIGIKTWDQHLANLLMKALLEPWGRPSEVVSLSIRLLKTDTKFMSLIKQFINSDGNLNYEKKLLTLISSKEIVSISLLRTILITSPIPDNELETFFKALCRHLLMVTTLGILNEDESNEVINLYCSLAQQCFINEYIYFQTPEEIDHVQQLRDRVIKALQDGHNISVASILAIACYIPLRSIPNAEKLLYQNWSNDIKDVLKQQIQEPLEEINLRKTIPVLSHFDNQVSLEVQSQYEENPYPRWVNLPKESSKQFLNSYIQSKFPFSSFKRLIKDQNIEILIAGCGTGQHSIGTSQAIKGAKILAIDLSMASLAYAKRKTIELDIDDIEYAQADLLKLKSISQTFDVIESSGVLHHLENPFQGWEVLLSLLKPYGLMNLGFYSELARRDIVRVRNLISKDSIGNTPQEIRDFREKLIGLKNSEDYGFVTKTIDFFSTSACRDLIFHINEHRMTLPILEKFLKDNHLNFLGFDIDVSVKQVYKNHFPNDLSATDLNNWHIYEEENPDTFIGMYQFWCQKQY